MLAFLRFFSRFLAFSRLPSGYSNTFGGGCSIRLSYGNITLYFSIFFFKKQEQVEKFSLDGLQKRGNRAIL